MNSDYRKMKILLIFDLPSVEKEDISNDQKFVKDIKKLGFYMLQYSVYVKSLMNQADYDRVVKKLNHIIPKKGSIIIFRLTDKQYYEMIYLNGETNRFDAIVGSKNVVYFGGDKD